ncbi:F-box only protein 40 isoform X4 [Hydra vulgaris]|uniref:F-box only protein 40 isoform X4 n=1 Tax=Hydra vulgaris TaxID=6087 RepID=A0ABM4BY92_HYDVU
MNSEGIHLHCLTCYVKHCLKFSNCPIIQCKFECGLHYHSCKQKEHEFVCTKQLRPCINFVNGCPFKLNSISLMRHLEVCPASVLYCGFSWNRHPLFSKVREKWLPFKSLKTNPVPMEGDLDIDLLILDQKQLNFEFKQRMRSGKKKFKEKLVQPSAVEVNTFSSNFPEIKKLSLHDNNFLTYDDLVLTHLPNFTANVLNTNISDGYYDIPTTGYRFSKKEYSASSSNLFVNVDYSLNPDDIHSRLLVHNDLRVQKHTLSLNVVLETLPRFQIQYPMYSFTCSKLFRRDQYSSHCLNIHTDIYPHLNDWMVQRCPLAAYGCPYSQIRLKPKGRKVCVSKVFGCFTSVEDNPRIENISDKKNEQIVFSILDLPEEVIEYLFSFLDSLSLNTIAKTCSSFRSVCYNMLDTRGIVVSCWKKCSLSLIKSSWVEDLNIRFFSTSCSEMRNWYFTDCSAIGNHMRKCVFFNRPKYSNERIHLTPPNLNLKIK